MPDSTIAGQQTPFGFGVRVEDRQLEDRFRQWHAAVADLTSFWVEKFAPKFLGDIQTNWDEGGAMVGGWAPNAPGYAAWKRRTGGQHLGVLEYTLRLRGSLQWLNARSGGDIGPDGVFRATARSLTIGTSVPYAFKHQYGTDGMVQRRFLFLADAGAYDTLWRDWIGERAVASGLPAA